MDIVSERIKLVRTEQGLSQKELAHLLKNHNPRLEISQPKLSRAENGSRLAQVDIIKGLCELFGYEESWFWGIKQKKTNDEEKLLQKMTEILSNYSDLKDLIIDLEGRIREIEEKERKKL